MKSVFILYTQLVAMLLLALLSCKKFVDIEAPELALPSSSLFTSDGGALAAAAGLYSNMVSSNLAFANGALTLYGGLSADELFNTVPSASYDAFRTASLTADESTVLTRFWIPAYKTIYHANAVLEGLEGSTALSEGVRRQLRGEMLVVRAFHYFYLVNLFGDVPYLTATDYTKNATHPRTPSAQIYSAIQADLEEAPDLLTEAYPAPGKGRPNRWAAAALLARVSLFRGEWARAEGAATAVLASGRYTLPALSAVFDTASTEVIWRLERAGAGTAEGATFIPPSATAQPVLALTPALLQAFASDGRREVWVKEVAVNNQLYTYPYKYRVGAATAVSEYLTVLRLAELYLIRAEARAQQGKIGEAARDLNIVRQRAGLPAITAADKAALLTAIEGERRLELAFEWGHRWLDLKRWGRAGAVLAPLKGSRWQSTDQLYPIPLSERLKNPALTQNPGY